MSSQPPTRITSANAPVAPDRVAPLYQPPSGSFATAQRVAAAWSVAPTSDLLVRANRAHDWVQGEAPLETTVYVTVTRSGQTVGTGQSFTSGCAWFETNLQDGQGQQVDLWTGDLIDVTAGELSASAVLIDMDGAVDTATGVVSGKPVGVPFPADVRVEVWSGSGDSRDLKT